MASELSASLSASAACSLVGGRSVGKVVQIHGVNES